MPLLGKKLGKSLPAVRAALQQADAKAIAHQVQAGQSVVLTIPDGSVELLPEEILVEALSPTGYAAEEQDGLVVALSTVLDEALVLEGTSRDLVRHIQELRKQSQLEISDRIRVVLNAPPAAVAQALEAHRAFILEETLADSLELAEIPEGFHQTSIQLSKEEPGFGLGLQKV